VQPDDIVGVKHAECEARQRHAQFEPLPKRRRNTAFTHDDFLFRLVRSRHGRADTLQCTEAARAGKINYRECFNRLTRFPPHERSLHGVSFDGKLTAPLQALGPLAFIQTDLAQPRASQWRAT
jgi:hypothetical protein